MQLNRFMRQPKGEMYGGQAQIMDTGMQPLQVHRGVMGRLFDTAKAGLTAGLVDGPSDNMAQAGSNPSAGAAVPQDMGGGWSQGLGPNAKQFLSDPYSFGRGMGRKLFGAK